MTISIAMASYNGGRYIREQLDSFAAQTLPPDELVICDDCSTDDTVTVIEDFARTARFKIRLFCNENRLGYIRNFEKALSLCESDIIFLSDQDDVWFPKKLDVVQNVFYTNPHIHVVINDAEIADGQMNPSGAMQFRNINKAGVGDRTFVTGCCTAITNCWRNFILPIPDSEVPHDRWINWLAYYANMRLILDKPLQYYRRHGDNVSNWELSRPKPPSRMSTDIRNAFIDYTEAWAKAIAGYRDLQQRFSERLLPDESSIEKRMLAICWLEREVKLLEQRLQLVEKKRLLRIPKIVQLYISGSYDLAKGWRSAVRDMLAPRTTL